LYWRLHCTSRQLARAIYALRKQGKLAKWDGNRNGFYELPLTLGEWGIRRAWFDAITQELEDHWATLEVDGLLKLKQRAENDKENL
jgi:hypothetical protein